MHILFPKNLQIFLTASYIPYGYHSNGPMKDFVSFHFKVFDNNDNEGISKNKLNNTILSVLPILSAS